MVQRNVLWLNFLMIPNTAQEKVLVETEMASVLPQLPMDMQAPTHGYAPVLSKGSGLLRVLSWWPMAYASGARDGLSGPGVVVLDDVDIDNVETLRLSWRQWLALFNHQQMLSGMLLATRTALDAGDCAGWTSSSQESSSSGATSTDQQMLSKDWADAIEQTLEHLRPGLRELAKRQAPVPSIGHELANERNQVVAEAEMAWPVSQLVLLTPEQDDMHDVWVQAGWAVLQLSENYLNVSDLPWAQAVALKLNIDLSAEGVSA